MVLKDKKIEKLKMELINLGISENVAEKFVLNKKDSFINHVLELIEKTKDKTFLLERLLELFLMQRNNQMPSYFYTKKDILKIFPISSRKFEEMVRNRLIPFYQITQKNKLFHLK